MDESQSKQDQPTIMVVEDETLLLQAITKKLKLSGLDVVSCASGQQALDYLESMDEKLPSAVWLDYYLKDMNGLAFMQTVKTNPKWSNIPVVVVSNSASPEKVTNMLALGARKYILKAEYRLDEIIQMMRDLIAEAQEISAGAAAAPPAPTMPASTPGAATAPPSDPA
jgi:CheY-like chemotaxis protein